MPGSKMTVGLLFNTTRWMTVDLSESMHIFGCKETSVYCLVLTYKA